MINMDSYLNDSGKSVNSAIEPENFQKAREVISELWSSVLIDGHKVGAEYIKPESNQSTIYC